MARLDMIGEDRGDARAAGRQARCEGEPRHTGPPVAGRYPFVSMKSQAVFSTTLDLLLNDPVQSGTNLFNVHALGQRLLCLMPSIMPSRMLAGLKLGGNERGGKSLNVATNWKTSSIAP